jgi:Fe-S-cluster containining protein
MAPDESIERLKKAILDDYPRMSPEDKFRFGCHHHVKCFNSCCADVNIFLTPYDVLRLKNRLGISSQEFLDRYTFFPIDKNLQYPVLVLKLQDDENKNCHFVDREKGCTVYEDRPWACRMYPVGLASPKEGEKPASTEEGDFYFLMKEEGCLGFEEDQEWTVQAWMENQGVPDYDEMGRLFKEITLHDFFQSGRQLTPEKMEMFFIACYNLDKFRDLIFKSTFFDRFKVDDALKEKLQTDDEELLRFGFRWLRFSLFGEKTLEVVQKPKEDAK